MLCLAICLCFPALGDAAKHALVIGNGDYEGVPLHTPVNDADAMYSVLRSLGFSVEKGINLDHEEMEGAIRSFGTRLSGGDTALFYFSGHGAQVKGINYLIPIGARIASADEIKYKAVNAEMVLGKMEQSGSQLNLIILDACRNNPFKGFKSADQGLAPMIAPQGKETLIAYATAPGSVAGTGYESQSIYTKYLAAALKTPGLRIEDVFKRVRASVWKETSGEQQPWESTSLMKDYYLAGGTMIRDEPDRDSGPRTGSLLVETTPKGARVYVNGVNKGTAPVELSGLEPRKVTVQSVLSGYRTQEEEVLVETGRIKRVTLVMDRIQQERTEPQQYSSARVTLRNTPRTLSNEDVQAMLEKYNFFDYYKNKSGNFKNDFVDNGDGTVTDRATGLMWQKGRSDDSMVYKEAQAYARNLKLAGYSDWRLPTLEELVSLLESKETNGRYIDPVFDKKQVYCWSADNRGSGGAWIVNFYYGYVLWNYLDNHSYVRAVRPRQ
jgi:hypothetical protein